MKYWIFVSTSQKANGITVPASKMLETRFIDEFWGLGKRTPNRKRLQPSDRVIFYESTPEKKFVARATLKSGYKKLTSQQSRQYSHNDHPVFTAEYGVLLEDIHPLTPIRVEDLVDSLTFIENKEFWYSYFTGGIREINENDYNAITRLSPSSLVEKIKATPDLQSQSQFALEAHLEEFMFNNWSQIDFGEPLVLYSDGDQNGRQFPAETWSIDFLCQDAKGDFVVIELKRGKTSDATVGQALRYIGWVKENLAGKDQRVRGIIVAHEIDNALQYSVSGLPHVSVMTYRVNFRLQRH